MAGLAHAAFTAFKSQTQLTRPFATNYGTSTILKAQSSKFFAGESRLFTTAHPAGRLGQRSVPLTTSGAQAANKTRTTVLEAITTQASSRRAYVTKLLGGATNTVKQAYATEWRLAKHQLRQGGVTQSATIGAATKQIYHKDVRGLLYTAQPDASTSLIGASIEWCKANPFTFGVAVATMKTMASDILVQTSIQGQSEVDWTRVKVFTAFGCLYLGAFQWFVYVTCFKRLFPGMVEFTNQTWREKLRNKAGLMGLVGQVAVDNFIHYPLAFFPAFYILKESIQCGDSFNPYDIVVGGLSKYWNNIVEDNIAIWSLWVPADLIVYSCPIWLRLPLNHAVSFVWTCILSFMRGNEGQTETAEALVEEIDS
mmetsp:Transcript_41571/g.50420  ORF Transcript_41571/g.50420 Transcript_41571/m.50420 type:complete len:368 (-) Transcript_41571:413-1516(-)|eukprot:CAMPEP_0197863860 /NCGR_PEP_ID=MMETSP1438-20131217/41622_1 /TAXON_ID=1461541 /ORGANISM="Pterosperma sp., Strain CCMP1384" /LENGTH=367 /DNA_ID=CAMNT_0043481903 /DNA_START=314 /DNA_END=1417 /DNA_ORIENTATION=+